MSSLVTLHIVSAYVDRVGRIRLSSESQLVCAVRTAVADEQFELAVEAAEQLLLAMESNVATSAAPAQATGVRTAGGAVANQRQLRQQGLGTVCPK